jgi:hypothetical protein
MSDQVLRKALEGRWLHSNEEDTAGEMVFRPAGHPLPSSRGRLGFELRPGGSATMIAIGRGDAPEELAGTWELDEDGPSIRLRFEKEPERALLLVSVEADRLVVRKG